jgi:hypothetical protein
MKRTIQSLIYLICLCGCALYAAPSEEETDAVVEELTQAFRSRQAFQANYRIEVPNMPANLSFILNQQQFFTAFILTSDHHPDTPTFAVVKYGGPGLDEGEIHMMMGDKAPMKMMKINISDVFRKPPAIFHALLLLTNGVLGDADSNMKGMDDAALWPELSFGLTKNSLELGFGFQYSVTTPHTNWLSKDWYTEAEKISLTPDTVIVDFPEGHQVTLNRSHGLIETDRWPNNEKDQPISIRLIEQKSLDNKFSIADVIPNFERMTFEDIPASSIIAPTVARACLKLNQVLEKNEDFDTLLTKDPAAIKTRIRNQARPQVRTWAIKLAAGIEQQDQITTHLQNEYARFLKAKPELVDEVTYEVFLTNILKSAEEDPENSIFPHLNLIVSETQKSYKKMLMILPLEEDAALLELYDSYIGALMDAWRIELMSATLERAKP